MQACNTYFLALGESLGIDIRPGEDGTCLIAANETLPVVLRANEEAQRMELTAAVAAELPEGTSYSDMLDLMATALGPLFDAPGIGRDPESGAIILYSLLPFATTTPADFTEAVPQFIDLAASFTARLAALDQE